MSALPPDAHFGALKQKGTTADATPPQCDFDILPMPRRGWPSGEACFTTAASVTPRAPIARKTGTGTLSPMDAYADRREANALTHRQAPLIVFRLPLPTVMGSLDQTILATALPTPRRRLRPQAHLPLRRT